METRTRPRDYALASGADQWLHHPVIGDPSWDTFVRESGNPIHRGRDPYLWPVNGTLFRDPVSRRWFAYVSVYPRGYWPPPPADSLILRERETGGWEEIGYVFGRTRPAFARTGDLPGAATDACVVFDDGAYHLIYGWCDAGNKRGGLAYASATRPEGPFTCADAPLIDDANQQPILGRYVRAYASTLIRRKHDWLILHMMSTPGNAGGCWALFAMLSKAPNGPYSKPAPLLAPQSDTYHPALAEFFPAFTYRGRVYAPATSVAANRSYQSLFSAPVEKAHLASSWRIERLGSLWHSEVSDWEGRGIWGQTIAGVVAPGGVLRVLYPAKDRKDIGGVGLAQRPWSRPMSNGFVLAGPSGPAHACLRPCFSTFELLVDLVATGNWRLCWSCRGPLGPSHPWADSVTHPLMGRDRVEFRVGSGAWAVVACDAEGREESLGSGQINAVGDLHNIRLIHGPSGATVELAGRLVWTTRRLPVEGRIELLADPGAYLRVSRFSVTATRASAPQTGGLRPSALRVREDWLAAEALSGSAVPQGQWEPAESGLFRFGMGYECRARGARAKWNVQGERLTLWAPRGPRYGAADVILDGRKLQRLTFGAAQEHVSSPVGSWNVPTGRHALIVEVAEGLVPCDSLTVEADA